MVEKILTENEPEDLNKEKHRQFLLSIVFFAVLALTLSIAFAAHFATNVYQNNDEFIRYAENEKSQYKQVFNVAGQTKQERSYGEPISYVVNYNIVKDENIVAYRDEKIETLKQTFKTENRIEEKTSSKKNKFSRKEQPLTRALTIDSATYTSANGTISIAIYTSDKKEKDKDMVKTSSHIETYHISKETGRDIVPLQTFKKNYRATCSQYFTDYFKSMYSEEELSKNYKEFLTDNENNFNEFVMTKDNVIFYFDEGTVLKKSQGVVSVKVANTVLQDDIRENVLKRYIDSTKPMVALTYDDGPGGASEARILDCLDRNNAVATFFYCGSRVSGNQANVKRAYDMGCEIGCHTWSHPLLTELTDAQVASEISRTNEAIKAACGSYPTVFRPSYGDTNDTVNKIANLPVIMWSLDTLDWKTRDPAKTFAAVANNPSLDGKIILMHSIHDPTATATETIVPWLIDHGYQTVTVSELIKYKTGAPPINGKVY